MGICRYDYNGYKTIWLLKTDLKPKELKKYGIIATQKEIDKIAPMCISGNITTGGRGYFKTIPKYNIILLKSKLNLKSNN